MTKALRRVKTKLIWNESFKFNLSHLWIIQRHQSSNNQTQEVYFGIDSTWRIRKNHPRNVSDSSSGETHFNCFHSVKWPLTTNRATLHVCVWVCACAYTYDKVEKELVLHLIQLKWIFKTVSDHAFNLIHSNFFFFKQGIIIQILPALDSFLCRSLLFQVCQIKNIWHYVFLSQKAGLPSPRFTYLKDMQSKLDHNPYYKFCT